MPRRGHPGADEEVGDLSLELSGPVPLFPLPELVFFPGTVLPLHIFEPRYRQMTQDQIEGNGMIAMALLEPGWEAEYLGEPPIHAVVTIGRIRRHERLPDGRFNLELAGMVRARVLEEVPGRSYRRGLVVPLAEKSVDPDLATDLQGRLLRAVQRLVAEEAPVPTVMLDARLTLGGLCDRLASLMPLEPGAKQGLLEETDPVARTLQLVRHLERLQGHLVLRRPDRVLPGFSAN